MVLSSQTDTSGAVRGNRPDAQALVPAREHECGSPREHAEARANPYGQDRRELNPSGSAPIRARRKRGLAATGASRQVSADTSALISASARFSISPHPFALASSNA